MDKLGSLIRKRIFNKNLGSSQLYKAFTLAEVLITLGIIGIVAAMTIPTIMNKMQDHQFKVAYKKAYSDANNVWRQMVAEGEVSERDSKGYDDTAATNDFIVFKGHFKVAKECGFDGGSNANCWDFTGDQIKPADTILAPMKFKGLDYAAFVDVQGRQWLKNKADNTFGQIIYVDINGNAKPNIFGRDRFVFYPVLQTCGSNNNINDFQRRGNGTPTRIVPFPYDASKDNSAHMCNIDNCYYKSWLYN